jgi:hypothetical protein
MRSAPIYQSWKGAAGFGPFHVFYPPSSYSVCGKQIAAGALVTTRLKPPPEGEECKTCALRDSLRVRATLAPSHPFGRNR